MIVNWISLDKATERRRTFMEFNSSVRGVDWKLFNAIEGAIQDRDILLERGRITPFIAHRCDDRNLGCSLSHRALWEQAASLPDDEVFTICEDDAVFHHDFYDRATRVLNELEGRLSIVFWGWNFDAHLIVDMLPGASPAAIACSQDDLRQNLKGFQQLRLLPQSLKLVRSFGTVAYSLTPVAARLLIKECTPLQIKGIDIEMNSHFRKFNGQVYVCFPPLVVTPNHK